MMTCPSVELLQRFLGNQLSPAEDAAVSTHVQGCKTCQEQLERLTAGVSFPDSRLLPPRAARPPAAIHPGLLSRLLQLPSSGAGDETPVGSAATAPDNDLTPGTLPRIPGYEIVAELGRGGMGVVYKARETALGRFVGLKMLLAGAQADSAQLTRFRREAEIIASLHHPNIVQIYAVGDHDGRLFFTMEYLDGGSLARHLGGKPTNPRTAAALVQTLANAVQAAHQTGVVHRDLKPANVLLSDEWRVTSGEQDSHSSSLATRHSPLVTPEPLATPKITDFGLAKRLDTAGAGTLSGGGPVVGSPSYMAPEQARGEPGDVGPTADVYALGAILYECLTGRPPFQAATPVDTVLQVLHNEPVQVRRLQPTVARDLETICLKCLHKAPARRYPSAGALAEDLGRFLAGQPIQARPVGAWERGLKWMRRRPAPAALLGVSAIAILAVGLLSAWYNLRLTGEIREVNRQRLRADGNLRQALQVVDGMLSALKDPRSDRVAELDESRRRQLDQAIRFYQGILAEPDNATAEARRLSGLAHYNLGRIHYLRGERRQAISHYQEAAALQQALADASPSERSYRKELAATWSAFSMAAAEFDQADDYSQRGLRLLTELTQEDPEDLDYRRMQLVLLNNRFHLSQDSARREQAEASLREALPLAETLVQRAPDDLDIQVSLAHSCTKLGLLCAQAGRWEEARTYLRKSLAVLEPHAQDQAPDRDVVVALAQTFNILALVAEQTGQAEERRAWCTRMIDTLEPALRPQLRDAGLRRLLAEAHGGRGVALNNLGRYAEALPDFDRLVALSDGPERVRYRALRALSRALARDHAGACAEAQELAGLAGDDGAFLYELARIHCFALNWARQDDRLTAAARKETAERYARQAVALLTKAQAAGFFRDPGRAELLRKEPDLKPLRERDDFRQLLR